jgi:hypothetical protein
MIRKERVTWLTCFKVINYLSLSFRSSSGGGGLVLLNTTHKSQPTMRCSYALGLALSVHDDTLLSVLKETLIT